MLKNIVLIWICYSLLSCSFSQKIKDGDMAYERKQYAVAIDYLEEEYRKTNNTNLKSRKAWLLGQSYLKVLEYDESKKWFKLAIDHGYGAEALAAFARLCKLTEDYESAIEAYTKLGVVTGKKQEADRDILMCRLALGYKSRVPEYEVEKIYENSSVSDYSPFIYDKQYLLFTSERKEGTGREVYNWTGERFSDIFIMLKTGSDVKKFDSAINTNANEGTPWLSKDLQTLYFTRCFNNNNGDDFCKIMISRQEMDLWTEPEALPFINDKINYGHPTLIENDSVLVFTADIEQPGGSTDLYYSELLEDGSWSVPEKLPASINSTGNEKFPTGDGDTLYFSSDYLPGMGGFDIFKTYLRKDGSWSLPLNMGYPINSGGDDFSFIVDYHAKPKANVIRQGFFTSSRVGTGKDDIFRFYQKMPLKEEKEIVKDDKKSIFVTVKTFTPTFSIPDDPNSVITGKTALGQTFIKIMDESTGQKVTEAYADNNGFYFVEIQEGKKYKIIGAKLEYLNASTVISTQNLIFSASENSKTINTELILDKIYTDKEINLSNIYYDYDKWDIKNEAKPTLDLLVKLLEDNPQIKIQLSSHTDCRGDDDYNLELSQKRAQSAIDYLIGKGISKDRLTAVGYGESQLVEKCICESCNETQHQINRRTTFKVLK